MDGSYRLMAPLPIAGGVCRNGCRSGQPLGRSLSTKGSPQLGDRSTTCTNYYVYDLQGQLIGEYDATNKVISETVYLGSTPVALIKQTIAGTTTTTIPNYIYADQIDAPRVITRASDNKMVWRWDQADPFGLTPASENPQALGVFASATLTRVILLCVTLRALSAYLNHLLSFFKLKRTTIIAKSKKCSHPNNSPKGMTIPTKRLSMVNGFDALAPFIALNKCSDKNAA
jgi:hypothetical protein